MLEILFRGKRLDNGEWVEGNLFVSDTDGKTYILSGSRIVTIEWEVDPSTVGQYTGLKDKNGERIFEGDIVECVSWNEYFSIPESNLFQNFRRVMVVVFHTGAFCMKESMPDPLRPNYWDLIYNGDIEIIGNIHDNPEFMKGDADNG